jgi:hypothetical protein
VKLDFALADPLKSLFLLVLWKICTICTECHMILSYSVFQGFSIAKSANGGSILSSSQFLTAAMLY